LRDEYLSADLIYKKAAVAGESSEEMLNKEALDRFTSLISKIKTWRCRFALVHAM